MRSNSTDAGSSLGSCGTNSPRKALARMDLVELVKVSEVCMKPLFQLSNQIECPPRSPDDFRLFRQRRKRKFHVREATSTEMRNVDSERCELLKLPGFQIT